MGAAVWADMNAEEQALAGPVLRPRLELMVAIFLLGLGAWRRPSAACTCIW